MTDHQHVLGYTQLLLLQAAVTPAAAAAVPSLPVDVAPCVPAAGAPAMPDVCEAVRDHQGHSGQGTWGAMHGQQCSTPRPTRRHKHASTVALRYFCNAVKSTKAFSRIGDGCPYRCKCQVQHIRTHYTGMYTSDRPHCCCEVGKNY